MTTDLRIIDMPFRDALAATECLAERSQKITDLCISDQQDWLLGMGHMLAGWEAVNDKTGWTKSKILYTVWKTWEHLSIDVTTKWQGDFYKWAAAYLKRRASREPAKETIDNQIGVYRDWEAEGNIQFPEKVYVPTRDEYGNLVDKDLTGENAWTEIDFDPSQCDFGKKLVARGTARDGLMSNEAWTALADPYATVEDLKREIREAKEAAGIADDTKDGPQVRLNGLEFSFFEQNGILYAGLGGTVTAFARLLPETADSPIAVRACEHMLNAIGIKMSPLKETMEMTLPLVQVVEDGVVISKGAERIGHFTKDEAEEIYDTIGEALHGT